MTNTTRTSIQIENRLHYECRLQRLKIKNHPDTIWDKLLDGQKFENFKPNRTGLPMSGGQLLRHIELLKLKA